MFNHLNDKQSSGGDKQSIGTNNASVPRPPDLPANNNQSFSPAPSQTIHDSKTTESIAPPAPTKPIPPKNLPNTAVDDIFSETDTGLNEDKEKPNVLQPKQADSIDQVLASKVPLAELNNSDDSTEGGLGKKILLGVIVAIVFVGLSGAGYWAFNKFKSSEFIPEDEDNSAIKMDEPIVEPINKQVPVPATSKPKDTDNDGLNDSEETELGTAIDNNDTDGDGLFDREEVQVYGTNPLVADTDGDGFTDGNEVEAGYNPNGSGKLYKK